MKKSVIFLLAFALIFVFVSCGTQSGGKPSKNLKFGGKELTLKYVSSEETEDVTKWYSKSSMAKTLRIPRSTRIFLVPKAKRKLLLLNELPEKRINQTLMKNAAAILPRRFCI